MGLSVIARTRDRGARAPVLQSRASMPLSSGQRLGPYEVQGPIGSGGMGEVYRARDTRLDRTVALKVLPEAFAKDPERLARFEREARTIGGLNHPHICTLFDIGSCVVPSPESRTPDPEPVHYLVMEHLAGETLAERLRRGPLPLAQALELGAQIADALDAAHKRGIIHRDLKPGNVMLATGVAGRSGTASAKLLDFGLAKLAAHGEAPACAPGAEAPGLHQASAALTQTLPVTARGTIVGTLQYMAPEQLEGKEADARTDLWALGALLYEMVTGRRAFEAASDVSLIGAILNTEPAAISSHQPLTPPALERLVRRCLAKHPDDRWDTAHDVAGELRWIRESSGVKEAAAVPGAARSRPWMAIAGAVLGPVGLSALGLTVWLRGTQQQAAAPVPGIFKVVQVTDQAGWERFPSLSPDGKSVVYASRASGNWDIYLQRVGGRNPINLTKGEPADDTHPAFSPDGEWIAFRSERAGGGLFIMGATGESVRRLTDTGYDPAWSPDGREIAYAMEAVSRPTYRGTIESQIWAVVVASGERRLVSAGDGVQPNWSPHGQRIAYWQYKGGQRDLVTVPAGGGTPSAVTNDPYVDWNPVWHPDGRHLYFSSNRGGSMNLWRVPIDESTGRVLGAFEPVTTPSLYSGGISFSRDGTLFAYEDWDPRVTQWKIGFDAVAGTCVGPPLPAPLPVGAMEVNPSRDGAWLAFVAGRNQNDIFVARTDGSELRQLTDDAPRDLYPSWSSDGGHIFFCSNRSGRFQLWAIGADGSGRRQLTEAAGELWWPIWSPDGTRIAAVDSITRHAIVFDATRPWSEQSPQPLPPLDGKGSGFRVTSWSPDGRLLAGTELLADGRQLGVLVHAFGERRYQMLINAGGTPVWLQDNRRLLFSGVDTLNLIDSRSRAAKELLSVAPHELSGDLSVSADNRTIYYGARQGEGNVWLASLK